jgi:phenylacetate-CoA ligase
MERLFRFLVAKLISPWFYFAAEKIEGRNISAKLRLIESEYEKDYQLRKTQNRVALIELVEFAGKHVPYYRELFREIGFEPSDLTTNFENFSKIPFLTKEIIRSEGDRLLVDGCQNTKLYKMKTGGSTGQSAIISYSQDDADFSSAITLYSRSSIGMKKNMPEVHFASRFPEKFPLKDRLKEHAKTLAMNRANIFVDSIDDKNLARVWRKLKNCRPYLVHAHPSTIYALALYVKKYYGPSKAFEVFESSGELLDHNKRKTISEALCCNVVDRYGLAEFGIVAYQNDKSSNDLRVYDTYVFPEMYHYNNGANEPELVFTSLRNRTMPLIRYRTGDRGTLMEGNDGFKIKEITGRIHDFIFIGGTKYPTHYIQDVLDRIGGVEEFQIFIGKDGRNTLKLVLESEVNSIDTIHKIQTWWGKDIQIQQISHDELARVGWRDKFRYVVKETD